jgi:hypothetical protein
MPDYNVNIKANASDAVRAGKEAAGALRGVNDEAARFEQTARKTAAATAQATSAKGQLKNIVNNLTRDFPLLGAAARLAVNPVVAAATLASMAFKAARDGINQATDSLETTKWDSYATSVEDAAEKTQKLSKELEAVADRAELAEKATGRVMDVFKARLSAEERRDNAQRDLELAKAGDDPLKKFEIEDRYARRKLGRDEAGRRAELARANATLFNQRSAAGTMDSVIGGMQSRLEQLGDPKRMEGELTVDKQRLAAVKKDREAQQERMGYLRSKTLIPIWQQTELSNLDASDASLAAQQTNLERVVSAKSSRLKSASSLKTQLGLMRTAREGLGEKIQTGAADLSAQMAIGGIESAAAQGAGSVESVTRAVKAGNEMDDQVAKLVNEFITSIEGNKYVLQSAMQKILEMKAAQRQFEERLANMR